MRSITIDRKTLKVYLPTDKTNKTTIRGLWRGSSGLCYDYIRQTRIRAEELGYLKKYYRQECLFYTNRGKAYIWYGKYKIEEYRSYSYFTYNRQTRGLKAFLKELLSRYGGFTIYIKDNQYLVEVWK